MVRRGILRQRQRIAAAVDRSDIDVEVISTPTVPRERDQFAVGRDRGIDFQSLESGDGHGPRRGRRGVTPSQPGPERRAHRRQAEGDDHHMPQTDSPGPGGLETRGGRNLGAHQGCRRGRCSRRRTVQRTDEPVAAAWQRLDIARDVGRIIERLAQAPNRRVQAGLEVDERIGGPEAIAQRLAGDELARTLLSSACRTAMDWSGTLRRVGPLRSSPERPSSMNGPNRITTGGAFTFSCMTQSHDP